MSFEKAIADHLREESQEKIDLIYTRLNQGAQNARFPKDKFDLFFAPYFLGQKPISKDSDIFSTWAGIAGSPMASVDIVDSNNNVVFTVPPLYNTSVIDLAKPESKIGMKLEEYQMMSADLPGRSIGYIEKELLPTLSKTISNITHDGYNEDWNNIAKHYNVPTGPTSENKESTNGIANNTDDDLQYDV